MLKYVDYDILFQEIPDEVTLAINLSRCPYRCKGCHSPQLQSDIGEELNEEALLRLLQRYGKSVTCICFMGGDADPERVCSLAIYLRRHWKREMKTAWYSGNREIFEKALICFDFIKTGSYIEELGGLDKQTTNQRLFRLDKGHLMEITSRLQRCSSQVR
jgi:anaerobic ribonucleoside-triphosphate reductase activating protein